MLALGILFVLSLASLIGYHLISLYKANAEEGELRAQQQSEIFVNRISDHFVEVIHIVDTLRATLLQLKESGMANRAFTVDLLTDILEEKPALLGLFTIWEPDAFDGQDARYKDGNLYHDITGRFIPYIVRRDEQIRVLPIHSYDSTIYGSWYNIPKTTKRFALIEPYHYFLDGQQLPMTSLVFPILDSNEKFMGVVGADFSLDFMQQEIEQIRPLGGYASIITAEHKYLAHGSDPSKMMQTFESFDEKHQNADLLSDRVVSLYTTSASGESVYKLIYPISMADALWHLEITIPKRNMQQSFRLSLRDSLFISGFALAVVVLLMMALIRRIIVRNIRSVIHVTSAMAKGDLRKRLEIRSGDEFETMASHFNQMIEGRLAAENHIRYQATHDMLTKSFNRKGFYEYIQTGLEHNDPESLAALLFIDLDRFKLINDSLNHEMGDAVLVEVSRRIRTILNDDGVVFRFGGDEFIVMLPEVSYEHEALRIAEGILTSIAKPIKLPLRQIFMSASIGIAIDKWSRFRESDRLIKEADTAMYIAKKERNTYKVFVPEMNQVPTREMEMENDLGRALAEGQFELYYQPKVDVATNRIYGAEALIRWQHPEWGEISPIEFVPIAERSGLINPIGEWVIQTACSQNRKWQDMGLPPLTIAVNISMVQFQQTSILEMIRKHIENAQIRPHLLELELTESVFMENPTQTLKLLSELKEMGVQISLDDFGTGYSSLSYLKNIPLDYLKLDSSFISSIETDLQEQLIVKSVIVIAHNLGLKVVTEGVETSAQYEILKEHLCDGIQGYYFSPPLPADRFVEFYRKGLAEEGV